MNKYLENKLKAEKDIGNMRFFIDRHELVVAATKASKASADRGVRPILANIMIEAKDDKIRFIGTNCDIMQISTAQADVEVAGTVTAPAKLFCELINTLPTKSLLPVTVELLDTDELFFSLEKVEFKIRTQGAEDFPPVPNVEADFITVKSLDFASKLKQVAIAHGDNNATPTQRSVFIDFENGEMIATDSKRLAVKAFESRAEGDLKDSFIVPAKAVNEVIKLFSETDKAKIGVYKNQLVFKSESSIIISRLLSGKFLDYKRVFPAESTIEATFNTKELLKAIKTILPIAKSVNYIARFKIKAGVAIVTSISKEMGSIKNKVECELSGEQIEIAFNAKFLQDFLEVIKSDKTIVKMTTTTYPAVFEADDMKYIVMPMTC